MIKTMSERLASVESSLLVKEPMKWDRRQRSSIRADLASFFKESKQTKVVFSKQDHFIDEHEEYCIHWIVPNAQKNEMEPILLELHADKTSMVFDPHDGEEFGYVLEGRILLVNGEKEYPVKKGETFYIHGKYRHYLRNVGKHDAKVLWITTPPLF